MKRVFILSCESEYNLTTLQLYGISKHRMCLSTSNITSWKYNFQNQLLRNSQQTSVHTYLVSRLFNLQPCHGRSYIFILPLLWAKYWPRKQFFSKFTYVYNRLLRIPDTGLLYKYIYIYIDTYILSTRLKMLPGPLRRGVSV